MNNLKNTAQEQLAIDGVALVMQGATFKDLRGISGEQMDTLYAFAHRFYEQGRLEEAERLFHFLCIYDFHNADYWCGNAAVRQLQGSYQKAIDLYAVAFALRISDYRPMLHTGQCHLALGRAGKAKLCFEYVVEASNDADLLAQARAYLDVMRDIAADHTEE